MQERAHFQAIVARRHWAQHERAGSVGRGGVTRETVRLEEAHPRGLERAAAAARAHVADNDGGIYRGVGVAPARRGLRRVPAASEAEHSAHVEAEEAAERMTGYAMRHEGAGCGSRMKPSAWQGRCDADGTGLSPAHDLMPVARSEAMSVVRGQSNGPPP